MRGVCHRANIDRYHGGGCTGAASCTLVKTRLTVCAALDITGSFRHDAEICDGIVFP